MIKGSSFAAMLVAMPAIATAAAESTSTPMSFEKCQAVQANTIAQLNVAPGDIVRIVNTSVMTMTRLYTDDGSVIITCSAPDNKMVITKSSEGR
ncbi:hypothetical protein [Pseudomonas guariconensis]|uniref:hypothetical protein n=1 Tax=Pseudomonas guariconensis TaxID=1288410 RepID=UPI0018AB29A3|nr:hypothetical protein [Pseudomonas guariconensis]MBF8753767.1 hypothetical protein [Pseudomonas guariconensis]MDM9593644.1 hypothetical protein [Pseudomonas guariconensis]MDM9606471.1 hypothetical protein [Pseudomonas guariconensis]MDM9611427.1 hypothetical protein [Pseudomonas guariconensis]